VTVNGIAGTKANSNGIEVLASNYVTIENCNISYSYYQGIWIWHTTTYSNYGVIQGCTVSYSGDDGIAVSDYATNWIIQNNSVHHNNAFTNDPYSAGIKITGGGTVSNITVQENRVYSNGLGQAGSIGMGIWIDTGAQNNIIRWNSTYDNNNNNIYVEVSPNNQVYGNLAYGSVQGCGIGIAGRSDGPMLARL
jgi:parallel beta-helix repeat protein